jgi:hypothetical protein
MAISMGAALLGSAIIGGVGSAVAGSKNSKAIRQSQAAQQTADAQSLAAQKEARNQNVAMQQPFYQTGLAANNRINALLGLGSTGPTESPQMGGANIMGGQMYGGGNLNGQEYQDGMMGGRFNYQQPFESGGYMGMGGYQEQPQGNALAEAQQGFSDWRDNTGYQFRFNEGMRAIDAGSPVRNSGSTIKAKAQYGQGIGSAEFYNYLGAVTGQQQVGVGAANALSGVQTNYANQASNIAQNTGNNAANAAVARANNTNSMIGGITSSFGNALGQYGAYKGW